MELDEFQFFALLNPVFLQVCFCLSPLFCIIYTVPAAVPFPTNLFWLSRAEAKGTF